MITKNAVEIPATVNLTFLFNKLMSDPNTRPKQNSAAAAIGTAAWTVPPGSPANNAEKSINILVRYPIGVNRIPNSGIINDNNETGTDSMYIIDAIGTAIKLAGIK